MVKVDQLTTSKETQMFTAILICVSSFVGYEGIEDSKVYFGIYTKSAEYGMVCDTKNKTIYCDVICIKK
jgi:hypothetical protein